MKAKRQYCCFLLAMLLSVALSSCSRPPAAGTEETGVSLTSSESASEHEASQKASCAVASSEKTVPAAFDAFTKQIFKDELEGSGLTLHYMLKDPESYGISTADPKLGECSLEYLEQVSADMEQLSEELHTFDPSLLTADQLFTYRALDDYLETELAARGLELYTRPVSTTIGTQAQLPILFAVYAFYVRQVVEDYLILMS